MEIHLLVLAGLLLLETISLHQVSCTDILEETSSLVQTTATIFKTTCEILTAFKQNLLPLHLFLFGRKLQEDCHKASMLILI